MQPSRFSPTHGIVASSRRLPLAIKLPLLMTGMLITVLAISVFAMHSALRAGAIDRARERVDRATRQFATLAMNNLAGSQTRYDRATRDSLVRAALRGARVNVAPVLARVSLASDSGMPVELWTADARRIAFVGNDVRSTAAPAGRPELPDEISQVRADARLASSDSIHLTPLYAEAGRIHFWIIAPVRDRGRVIGYIAHQRRVAQNPTTMRTLREIAGDSVTLYYRNIDGTHWTGAGGYPIAPLVVVDSADGIARAGDERVVVHEERVGSTPLVLGMSIPEKGLLTRALRPVRTILLLSVVLVVLGGLAAWAIGRRIARPLTEITRAAESFGTGDLDARVPETGDREVRRLAQAFNHMAAEVGESRRALEKQTAEARSANNAKSDFLTTMSHELRTPLNAIGGYVELLEMELRGPLTGAQRRDLDRIKASQQHLLGLISGVLDLARVESGTLAYDLTNIALDPFLSSLDALIEPQAATKQIELDYIRAAPDIAVLADREKLRQILLNLISNAIRHTPAGGRVILRAERLGGRVQIAVEDTGPGVPADKRDEIFEPFVQLDRSLSQPREGLGLGLAISRDLARGMSGDLTVDTNHVRGARFLLTLNRGSVEAEGAMMFSGEMPVVS